MYSKPFNHNWPVHDKTAIQPTWQARRKLIFERLGDHFADAQRQIAENRSLPDKNGSVEKMRLRVFDRLEDAESVWSEFARYAAGFFYQQYSWCKTWYDTIGKEKGWKPHIVLVSNVFDDAVMLLPLGITETQTAKVVTFAGEGMSDYIAPLIYPDFARKLNETEFAVLWNKVLESFGQPIDMVWCERAPETVADVPNPLNYLPGRAFRNKAHALSLPSTADWHACANTIRSKKTIKKIERRIRQLAGQGDLELVSVTGEKNRLSSLDRLIDMKVQNLNEAGILHRMGKGEIRTFYSALVASEAVNPNVYIFELLCGGKLVASVLALVHHDTFYYQVCAYEKSRFGQYSPGVLLMYMLMKWSFERKLKFFDMTIGDEAYKYSWANTTVAIKTLALPFSARGHAACVMKRLNEIGKSQIRESTLLKPAVLKLLSAS